MKRQTSLHEDGRVSVIRTRRPLLLAALLLGLTACGISETALSTVTTTTMAETTTSSIASTTTSTSGTTTTSTQGTSTSTTSTTLDLSWRGPEPCSDCPAHEVVATVPVLSCSGSVDGFVGLTPECRAGEPFGGTIALIGDSAGGFWIADILRFERVRLLHVDPVEATIDVVDIPDDVISVEDIAQVTGGLAMVWVDGFNKAFIEIVDDAGDSLQRMPLDPIEFGGMDGLALVTIGDRLYIERNWGVHAAVIDMSSGPQGRLRGYDTPYGFYSISPISTPEASIAYEPEGTQGTVMLLGVNPDGSLVVVVDDVSQSPTNQILVDQYVRWYRRDGTLTGVFEFPLAEQVAPVQLPLVLGDDGYVYGLLTRRDHADIVRFNFQPGV